ncbi:MAG: esterase [Lentisphaeria bacterium]
MSLHFKKSGSGDALVLIHGLFGSLENLGAIARLLSAHFTVYSVDLPNHGRSLHTETTSLESLSHLLLEWLDQQQLQKVHIFGHSLGGKVGMELALRHPERVDRLVVVDIAPVHYEPHHHEVFGGLLAIDPTVLASRAEADTTLKQHVDDMVIRSFLLKNLVKEPGGHFSWRMNLPVIHRGYAELVKGNHAESSFHGDTLFLKGGNSDYIKEHFRDDILSRFPKAGLKVIANTGHWLHAEKPEIVAKITQKFFSQ